MFFGTTYLGGASNLGTVYSLTPPASPGGNWTETTLHSFKGGIDDGANPVAGLVIGGQRVLFGTTVAGGTDTNAGTAFSLAPTSGGAAGLARGNSLPI